MFFIIERALVNIILFFIFMALALALESKWSHCAFFNIFLVNECKFIHTIN